MLDPIHYSDSNLELEINYLFLFTLRFPVVIAHPKLSLDTKINKIDFGVASFTDLPIKSSQ